MQITCIICGSSLELNQDSQESRDSHTDPYQQMRRHLNSHFTDSIKYGRKLGWLVDSLCFVSTTEPAKWRDHLIRLVDHFQSGKE